MYKLKLDPIDNVLSGVFRLSDNAFIPFDPQNSDYAEYLKWLAKGNEPIPAEEQ